MTIHWVGTGLSAIPGLRRLLTGKTPVVVWNRTVDKARAAVGDLAQDIRAYDPQALTEALAAGCYIVASDTEPVRELVRDGENGRLVPFFDGPALEAALIRGLAGDPEAGRLRAAARQTIVNGYDLKRDSLPKLVNWVESFAPR